MLRQLSQSGTDKTLAFLPLFFFSLRIYDQLFENRTREKNMVQASGLDWFASARLVSSMS